MIDMRSDTVTQPTEKMRSAMYGAFVGDDVYGDDPTVATLEEMAAQILGKEAALFVPSGTFGNQLALFTHCQRGEEVLLGDECHIVAHEAGASAIIAGVQLRTLNTIQGKMNLNELESKIRKSNDIHFPKSRLICLENAHSLGQVIDLEYMQKVKQIASKYDLKVHLDGARLFNAAVALNTPVEQLASQVDTVMICLSKGLCAPVGSLVVGEREWIARARKNRKIMGGGMRQVGILAAAGIIALTEMKEYLAIDHQNAKYLAQQLAEIPGIEVDQDSVQINLVFFKLPEGTGEAELVEHFRQSDILVNGPENGMMRLVTHYWIDRESIDHVIQVFKHFLNTKG